MSFVYRFAETNSTHVEIPQVPMLSTTLKASTYDFALVLWRAHCAQFD